LFDPFFSLFIVRYEEINVNLVDKPEWYLQKNAPGQVPSLEWIDSQTKETRFIPESLIVSDYLDEAFPGVRLQPTDSYLKAKQRVLVERFSSVNHKRICRFFKDLVISFRSQHLFIKYFEAILNKAVKI